MVFGDIVQYTIITPFALYIIYWANLFGIQDYVLDKFYLLKWKQELEQEIHQMEEKTK